jgi:hypothetical protein
MKQWLAVGVSLCALHKLQSNIAFPKWFLHHFQKPPDTVVHKKMFMEGDSDETLDSIIEHHILLFFSCVEP